MTVAVSGAGAPFWGLHRLRDRGCGLRLRGEEEGGASKTLMVVAAIGALATSVMFRVLIYQLGYPVV